MPCLCTGFSGRRMRQRPTILNRRVIGDSLRMMKTSALAFVTAYSSFALLAEPACHQSTSTAADAAGDAQRAPTAGGSGGRGDAGSVGSGGSGGGRADGSAPDTKNAETPAGPMTPTEACQASIRVQCERRAVCSGVQGTVDLAGDICLRFANICPDYYFSADSNRTVAEVTDCLPALAAQSCTDILLGIVPPCLARGDRPANSPCAYGSQCQGSQCRGSGNQCVQCDPTSPIGGSCNGAACEQGAFCNRNAFICEDASTVVYAPEGQPCKLFASPVIGCAGDLLCATDASQSCNNCGICSRLPGLGEPCAHLAMGGAVVCGKGMVCSNSSGGGTCVPKGTCGIGATCDDASYCRPSDQVCAPRAGVGQACGDGSSSSSLPPCLAPAKCVSSTGKCALAGGLGDPCDNDHPCAELLSCTAGTCQTVGSCPG